MLSCLQVCQHTAVCAELWETACAASEMQREVSALEAETYKHMESI